MELRKLEIFEKFFWVVFVLFPLITGFLSYDWLPNESFDERIHHKIKSSFVETDPTGGGAEVVTVWESKKSGQIFTKRQFYSHRHKEALRIGVMTFLYGMLGSIFYAYTQVVRKVVPGFIVALKDSAIFPAIASGFFIFFTW
jgi:hypothetical protein